MTSVLNMHIRRFALWGLFVVLLGAVVLAGGAAAAEGAVEGTIVDEVGEPIDNAAVNIVGEGIGDKTNSQGEYRINNVPYGEQNLSVTHPEYESNSRDVTISTTSSPDTEDFTLVRPTVQLTLTARATTGSEPIDGAIPSATVNITHTTEQDILDAKGVPTTGTTDDNGQVTFEVTTGAIDVTVRQDGFTENQTTVTVTSGGTSQDIRLDAKFAKVSGTVENTDDEPIPNANVSVEADTFDIWPNLTASDLETQTDSSGSYTITDIPQSDVPSTTAPTERTIVASAPTFIEETASLEVNNDKTENFTLTQTTGTLSGTVTGPAGTPLKGVTVEVVSEGTTTTGTDGSYSLSVPIGTHDVEVGHPDYKNTTQTVEVDPGGTTKDFSIDRTTPVSLSIDSVYPRSAQPGDVVTVEFSLNEPVSDDVAFSVTGPQQLADKTVTVDANGTATTTVTAPDSDTFQGGEFKIKISALGATDSSSFTVNPVTDPAEVYGELGEPVTGLAGSFVTMPTGGEYMIIGGDKRGGSREPYLDILKVNSGSTVLNTRLLGTNVSSTKAYGSGVTSYAHSIGAGAGPSEREGTPFADVSFEAIEGVSSLAGLRDKYGISALSKPLQSGRFQLIAGGGQIRNKDNSPTFVNTVGRSSLVLKVNNSQDIGEITTYVLPPGSADKTSDIGSLLSKATRSETVAIGERLLIEVPARGMWGATLPRPDSELTADRLDTLLERPEGVYIEFDSERFGGPNTQGGELQFENVAKTDLNPIVDKTTDLWNSDPFEAKPNFGGYYLVIDTRGDDPFDSQPDDGDVLQFNMSYRSPDGSRYQFKDYGLGTTGQPAPFDPLKRTRGGVELYPYFGEDARTIRETAQVRFVEPSITYARTRPNGELLVSATGGGKIVGSTTMVPGTEMVIRLTSYDQGPPEVLKSVKTTVTEERTFSVSADFSALTPGQRVKVDLLTNGRLKENRVIDRRFARIVEEPQNPARFNIKSFPGTIEVKQRESLEELKVKITNDGTIVDRQMVHFRINGEPIRNESVLLNGGGSTTLDLSEQFVTLPTGTHNYTVATEDDTQTGQLTVTGPDSGTVITEAASQGATTSSAITGNAEGSGETTGGTDDGGDSGEPSGLFSLMGVRTRDVAVATAIAGATHILGYWT